MVIPNLEKAEPPLVYGPTRVNPGHIRELNPTASVATGATEMPHVMVAPEPAPTPEGVREGSAFSVPREQIPEMIKRGSSGAGNVYRSTGGTLIYEPKGVGFPKPRSIQHIKD
jgi:hypothetical protein